MNYDELLMKRRSIRDFEDKAVPLDVIKEIINESVMAPNAGNRQPWSFIIVSSQELMQRISTASKNALLIHRRRG